MIINNNAIAGKTYTPYSVNLKNLEKSAKRLATGEKFANATEGMGELSIADRLRLQVVGTQATLAGMNSAMGYAATQDDILGQVADIISRMKELSASAIDPTKSSADRTALNTEFRALDSEVQALAANSKYNGVDLFDNQTTVRVGLESTDTVTFASVSLSLLTFVTLSLNSVTTASAALTALDTRMGSLNSLRITSRTQGARVERAMTIAQSYVANIQNAHSAIRDVDIAQETGEFTKRQVMLSASQAILAQANSTPQNALQFLQF